MNSANSPSKIPSAELPVGLLTRIFVRHGGVNLLIAMGLLFGSAPIVQDLPNGDLIEALLVTLVMGAGVLAVGGRHRSLVAALVLVAPALVGKWYNHVSPNTLSAVVYLVAAVAFFGFVVAQLIRFLVRAPGVDANVLCAGVSGFLLIGLLWSPIYLMVARVNPVAFTLPANPTGGSTLDGFTALYFSFITLTTVGYGDILPVSRVARMLAAAEAVCGLFYMAVLISRLVSVYSSKQPNSGDASRPSG